MGVFEGVVPAIATPMGQDGRFNEAVFRKIVEFNIEAGVHGFWVAGGTGESVLLDDDENMQVASAIVDQSNGRAKVIMHVGAPTTDRAARLAEHAARVGADALCCVPPFFYRRDDDDIAEHYRIVAGAADLPLFVYNLPGATGVEITPGMMAKIQDCVPQLKGLKHSASTFANVRDVCRDGVVVFYWQSSVDVASDDYWRMWVCRWAVECVSRIVGGDLECVSGRGFEGGRSSTG